MELFDARSDILDGATARCQARLHRGYHYPRSDATALAARDSFDEFTERYSEAVKSAPAGHHYLIAAGGKTNAEQYLEFCQRLGLPYTISSHPMAYNADLVLRVPEAMIDANVLRRKLRSDLAVAGVVTHLLVQVDSPPVGFDYVIWATYGQPWARPLRYEICELAVIELGRYAGESFVVMDGDFVSLDPWHGLYALYDVQHTVHHSNVGMKPEIPPEYAGLLARSGLVKTPLSRVDSMLDSAGRFLRMLDPGGRGVSISHGSMFSIRAVLPDVDDTDERPSLIEIQGDQINVLSGKICTAPAVARSVVEAALELAST